MSQEYASAAEHYDEQIARIAVLFEHRIRLHWEQGVLPRIKDEFSGTFVSGDEVAALLAGGLPISTEGDRTLTALEAAFHARGDAIERRLAATAAAGQPLPWDQFRRAFKLTPTEELGLWLLIAAEMHGRFRQLARYLANDSARIHSDLGLLEVCVYSAPQARELFTTELAADGALLRYRLIQPIAGRRAFEDAPMLLRAVRPATRVIELARGRLVLDREVAAVATLAPARASAPRAGDPELVAQVHGLLREAAAAGTRGESAPALVLIGPEGVGKRALVGTAAHALGCPVLSVRTAPLPTDREELHLVGRAIVREAILHRAILLVEHAAPYDASAAGGPAAATAEGNRRASLGGALADSLGPVVITTNGRDPTPFDLGREVVRLIVPAPLESARVELWRRTLASWPVAPELDIAQIAARYAITGGVIEAATRLAAAIARGRGADPAAHALTAADLHAGIGAVLDAKMSTMGTRVTRKQKWSDLVLPKETMSGIAEFVTRLKHRRLVYEQWGFAAKLAKGLGVSALFAGPPGTGKTMVAGLVADELGLDLYQIDLSRIVSKYVGETEKNLSDLFDAAEAGHAMLLFDEADSLFAKRTEVKSSVDRYANLEVNFLLQRMERFEGVTILTTNLESSIDSAFKRRLSFRLDFPFPGVEERERLWASMIPELAEVAGAIDYGALAKRYEMAGGNVRNAVLRAAFLAAGEGKSLSMTYLRRAAELEYGGMGKVMSSGM